MPDADHGKYLEAQPEEYEPAADRVAAEATYERFLAVTGLAVDEPATVDA